MHYIFFYITNTTIVCTVINKNDFTQIHFEFNMLYANILHYDIHSYCKHQQAWHPNTLKGKVLICYVVEIVTSICDMVNPSTCIRHASTTLVMLSFTYLSCLGDSNTIVTLWYPVLCLQNSLFFQFLLSIHAI